ncbi:hypothetical protein ACLB2K_018688 [Fragaria x ananassa]
MVLLHHLPRSHLSLFTHFTHFSKPKLPTTLNPILNSTLFSSPKIHSLSLRPHPHPHPHPRFPHRNSPRRLPYPIRNPAREALRAAGDGDKVHRVRCPEHQNLEGVEHFAEQVCYGCSGKSSLLNSLVRRKKLALTSKKPGKTQCINHFRINDSWYLVDLPGYGLMLVCSLTINGYAAAPQELRTDWVKFTKDYFLNRSTLVSVFLLIDASIPAKKIDLEYAS